MNKKALVFTILFGGSICLSIAQSIDYAHIKTITHSHNDYEQANPLFDALALHFTSIEVDIFLRGDSLFVAHQANEIKPGRTLLNLYIEPLRNIILKNKGSVYGDGKEVILFIDIKADGLKTYKRLHEILQIYKNGLVCFADGKEMKGPIRVIVSGDRPFDYMNKQTIRFAGYDGRIEDLNSGISPQLMPIISADWNEQFMWNGIGEIPKAEKDKLDSISKGVKEKGYLLRFWGLPNLTEQQEKNCWYELIRSGVGVIGSDNLERLQNYVQYKSEVLEFQSKSQYKGAISHRVIKVEPSKGNKVKNVILMIADGMGISHYSSAWIANHGQMNIDNCMYTGLVKTFCANHLITDSGAAGTAMATGQKANYHSIAVDTQNNELPSLTDLAHNKGLETAVVVTCGLTDATPATFCASNPDRDEEEELASDFLNCNVDFLFGGGRNKFQNRTDNRDILAEMKAKGYKICNTWEETDAANNDKIIAVLEEGQLPLANERGDLFQKGVGKALKILSENKKGFFAMFEGSRIDDCGHWNDLPKLIEEITDFDSSVGQVLQWAEKDKHTLVIILADHETGGFSITGGSLENGQVEGHFANKQHSGILVPVYAYGPQSQQFTGVIDNTDIFNKIKAILNL